MDDTAPHPRWHLAAWGAEFAGTALLILGGLGAVTLDFGPGSPVAVLLPSASARLLLTGALFAGTGSLVAVSPLGRLSGAHLNPAMTFAFWLQGQVRARDLAGYCAAQCAGATAGAALLLATLGDRFRAVHMGVTAPGHGLSDLEACLLDGAMTGLLVVVVFGCLLRRASARWTPFASWAVVTLLVWQGAPYTGTSLNPARSLGPALVAGNLAHLPDYLAGPPLGAAVAVLAFRAFSSRFLAGLRPLTAKLFHDVRYPSTFRRQAMPSRPAGR